MSELNKENQEEQKKTVIKETDYNKENETSGETSSVSDLDRSGFTKKTGRSHKPLGASHEPGATPGTEI